MKKKRKRTTTKKTGRRRRERGRIASSYSCTHLGLLIRMKSE